MSREVTERDVFESKLKMFRHNVNQMMYFEEKLHEVALLLEGDSIKSPPIVSKDESKYQKGTQIYNNRTTELMLQESYLIKRRDYYLTSVREIMNYLQQLDPEEVELVELRYYKKFEAHKVGKCLNYDKRTVYRKLDRVFKKLSLFDTKFMV